ncbi:MAG: hypothetical protein ACLRJV_22660 [Eubacteriales bacterium]
MLLTNDQRFLLDILREVRYMRLDQILPLMRLRDPAKAKSHCEAILRYLRYAGELVPVGDDLVCLAEFRGQEADPGCCARWTFAVSRRRPAASAHQPEAPYKLCFLLEQGREVGKSTHSRSCRVEPDRTACQHPFGAAVSGCDRAFVPVRFGTAPAFTYQSAALLRHPEGGSPAFFKGGEASQ